MSPGISGTKRNETQPGKRHHRRQILTRVGVGYINLFSLGKCFLPRDGLLVSEERIQFSLGRVAVHLPAFLACPQLPILASTQLQLPAGGAQQAGSDR